jgi:chromosome segregation ATPase
MAIERTETIESINYHVNHGMVDIAWSIKLIEDGEVISQDRRNGACPVDKHGKIIDHAKTAKGFSLSDILGQAGADAQANLKAAKDDCDSHRVRAESAEENAATLLSEKEALIAENESLRAALEKLGGEINTLAQERNSILSTGMAIEAELNQVKSVLAIKDATIESLQAAKQAAKGE